MMSHDKPTVVCVDDEPLVSRSLYRLLSREPYDVLLADTPRQALRYVKDYDVDLVITDQRMPDMSGVELLQEIRQVSPRTGGLILTAYPESVLVDDPPEAPSPPLFAKPWDDETLRDSIRELLRGKAAETRRKAAARVTVRKVLVPVNGSIEPELALTSVMPILRQEPMKLTLLQVLPDLGLHRDVYAYLERTRSRLASDGIDAIADVRWGDPAEQIVLHARHADADLIVISEDDEGGLWRSFRRTLAERILDECAVPILIGRSDLQERAWKRILVPLDGMKESEEVLPDAARMARQLDARLDLVSVSPTFVPPVYGYASILPLRPSRRPYLLGISKGLEDQGVLAELHTAEGDPAREILHFAQECGADLICMAAKPRTWPGVFGGVLRKLVRRAPCPVFVRRAIPSGG
jgi:nucleotide-binding universal stress UspA family protein